MKFNFFKKSAEPVVSVSPTVPATLPEAAPAPAEPLPVVPKRLVICDFDGVLIDSLEHLLNILSEYNKELKFGDKFTSYKDVKKLYDFKISNISLINKAYGLLYGGMNKLAENVRNMETFAGLKEALQELRDNGVVIGVVTVNYEATVEDFLKHHGIRDYFKFILSAATPEKKMLPDKTERLRQVVKEHGEGHEIYYLSGRVDYVYTVRKKLSTNVTPIAALWGHYDDDEAFKKEKVDLRVQTPLELVNIVLKKEIKQEAVVETAVVDVPPMVEPAPVTAGPAP